MVVKITPSRDFGSGLNNFDKKHGNPETDPASLKFTSSTPTNAASSDTFHGAGEIAELTCS
jgi:hypothetical protein